MLSKGLILYMIKGVQEECQEQKQAKGEDEGQLIGDVMEMLKNISSCLDSFSPKFESYVGRIPPCKDLTQNTRAMWLKKGTHAWLLTMSMH